MQELINNPVVIDLIAAVVFLAAACAGLIKGFYKQIMPLQSSCWQCSAPSFSLRR